MKIKIINNSPHPLPEYKTEGSAGMDLIAFLDEETTLKPFERKLIPTGIHIELSSGYEAQVRPRSGWALKHGITCLNTPGTIDSDYRGEIKVILANLSNDSFQIKNGDRIAQLVIAKYEKIIWEKVTELSDSSRGERGFGSTGFKN